MRFFGTQACLCRLQNCPSAHFGVFKYTWAAIQKVWNEAENGVWGSRVLLLRHALPTSLLPSIRYRILVIALDFCCIYIGLVFIKDRPLSSFWVLRFRNRVLCFRVLGASFSRFGCFMLRSSFSSASFSKLPSQLCMAGKRIVCIKWSACNQTCVQWSPLGNGKVTIIYKVTAIYWFDCISLLYVWPHDGVKRFLKVLTSD